MLTNKQKHLAEEAHLYKDDWFDAATGRMEAVHHTLFLLIQVCVSDEKDKRKMLANGLKQDIAESHARFSELPGYQTYQEEMELFLNLVEGLAQE